MAATVGWAVPWLAVGMVGWVAMTVAMAVAAGAAVAAMGVAVVGMAGWAAEAVVVREWAAVLGWVVGAAEGRERRGWAHSHPGRLADSQVCSPQAHQPGVLAGAVWARVGWAVAVAVVREGRAVVGWEAVVAVVGMGGVGKVGKVGGWAVAAVGGREGWAALAAVGREGWAALAAVGREGWVALAVGELEGWVALAVEELEGWAALAAGELEGWVALAVEELEGWVAMVRAEGREVVGWADAVAAAKGARGWARSCPVHLAGSRRRTLTVPQAAAAAGAVVGMVGWAALAMAVAGEAGAGAMAEGAEGGESAGRAAGGGLAAWGAQAAGTGRGWARRSRPHPFGIQGRTPLLLLGPALAAAKAGPAAPPTPTLMGWVGRAREWQEGCSSSNKVMDQQLPTHSHWCISGGSF